MTTTPRRVPPSKRRKAGPRRKPGPRPVELPLQGRDYYCGSCIGRRVVTCPDCVIGCAGCREGFVKCPDCRGGTVPVAPPEWVFTPRPPRCHHAETGENPVPWGPGERDTEASQLADDSTGDP